MTNNRLLIAGLMMVMLMFLMPAAAQEPVQSCQIRFARDDKTGQRTEHEVSFEKTVSVVKFVQGKPDEPLRPSLPPKKVMVTAKFTREVLEAPNSDNPLRLLVTFSKLTKSTQDAPAKDVLPAGAQVRASAFRGDPLVFEPAVAEVTIDADCAALLSMVVQTPDMGDEECYGIKGKKVAGDSWPVNQDAVKRLMPIGPNTGKQPDTVEGKVTLVKFEKIDGVECVQLTAIEAAKYKPITDEGTPGIKDMGAVLNVHNAMVLPVNLETPVRGRSSDMTTVFTTHTIMPTETIVGEIRARTQRDEKVKMLKEGRNR